MNTIGFVGVGRMGSNMALRLKDQGYVIGAIYDTRSEAASELAADVGATQCNRLSEVTNLCDVVITVVTDDAAMRSIFGLEDGGADTADQRRWQGFELRHDLRRVISMWCRPAAGATRLRLAWLRASPRRANALSDGGGDKAVFEG
jgi:hypothetical protein